MDCDCIVCALLNKVLLIATIIIVLLHQSRGVKERKGGGKKRYMAICLSDIVWEYTVVF